MRLLDIILASSIFFTAALCVDRKLMVKTALKRCLLDCNAASKTVDLEEVDVQCTQCIYRLRNHPCHPCAVARMAGVPTKDENAICSKCFNYSGFFVDNLESLYLLQQHQQGLPP